MTITISAETAQRLQEKALAEGLSIEAYVEQLVREDEEWGDLSAAPLTEPDPQFSEVKATVMEGLEQAKRGEGHPAEEVFANLRAKHGISR